MIQINNLKLKRGIKSNLAGLTFYSLHSTELVSLLFHS